MARIRLKAAPEEGFWQHVDNALKELELIFLKRKYPSLVWRRLGVKPELFEEVLRVAVAYHDLGKAYQEYQRRIPDSSGVKWSVPKHEYFSALALWRIVRGLPCRVKKALTAAVMLHHIATRGPRPEKSIYDWDKYKAPREVSLSQEVFDELVEGFRERVPTSIADPSLIPLKLSLEGIKDLLYNELRSFLAYVGPQGYEDYALTLFILRPIIVCDCRAAGLARSRSLRPFVKDIPSPSVMVKVREVVVNAAGWLG